MTILTFPAINAPSAFTWALRGRTQVQESPLDGSTQTLRLPGAAWTASLSWQTLPAAQWRLLSAFLSQLGGRAGRFTYGPTHHARQAAGTGTVVVDGAGQSGSALNLRGWAANAAAFKAGDYLSFADVLGRQCLHQATADCTADASGFASVAIAPPLRRAAADGEAVEITAPLGVFRLVADDPALSIRPPLFGAIQFDIVEALVGT